MTDQVVSIPIEGVLDLHTFDPKDVKELLPEYIRLCRDKGIMEVRIIHGKGTGSLKTLVLAQLKKIPAVDFAEDADVSRGAWGATVVYLK
jgi:DNA-nicking Smr family endonuclease